MTQLVFDAADADRGADEGSDQGRLQLARGCRGRRLGGREARDRRRDASRRLSRGRLAREQVHRGALPRQLGRRRRRLRQHRRPPSRAGSRRQDDPERSGGGGSSVPVDHVRGPLGRAPGGVLQRADRSQHEGPVAPPDRVVAGLARSRLRGAGGRRLRHGRDRPVLQRRRQGLEGARAAAPQPRHDAARARDDPRPARVRGRPRDLAAGGAAAARPATLVGPDHLRLGSDVRPTPGAVPRHRRAPDPARHSRSRCCSGSCSA